MRRNGIERHRIFTGTPERCSGIGYPAAAGTSLCGGERLGRFGTTPLLANAIHPREAFRAWHARRRGCNTVQNDISNPRSPEDVKSFNNLSLDVVSHHETNIFGREYRIGERMKYFVLPNEGNEPETTLIVSTC